MAARTISLLDEDPDLGESLDPARRAEAAREVIADVVEREPGLLEPLPGLESSAGALGLLVLDGLVTRRTTLAGRRGIELLGVGDLLRPWQDDGHHDVAPFDAAYTLLEPTRLAILDRRAALRIGRWPEVMCSLFQRAMSRSRTATGHLVLAQIPRVDERLHVLLWHLADRWGRVTSDGVVLPLRLSHELLGSLIGAQRPTVTLALGQLTERGAILRRSDRTWLLLERPPGMGEDDLAL